MNANAKIVPLTQAVAPAANTAGSGGSGSQSRLAEEAERVSRYRLVIEEGPAPGSFIYKTLDRVTGEVVRQMPREEIVQMMDEGAYSSGSIIDTAV